MSTVIGILVFLILIAFVYFLKMRNDQGRPPI
jgi:preprotein translocase subunit YajC